MEGHVHALSVLGGVPRGKVRYDNLKAAVAQVLGFSRQRTEPERWIAFRSHWGIESFYCRPGTGLRQVPCLRGGLTIRPVGADGRAGTGARDHCGVEAR